MRLPRLTTRRLMVLVAAIGLALGVVDWGWRLKERRDHCLRQARLHALFECGNRYLLGHPVIDANKNSRLSSEQEAKFALDRLLKGGSRFDEPFGPNRLARMVQYHAALKSKYVHFTSRPWLRVPPDPPMPE